MEGMNDEAAQDTADDQLLRAMASMSQCLNAVTDDQIAAMTSVQRYAIFDFLLKSASRFAPSEHDLAASEAE